MSKVNKNQPAPAKSAPQAPPSKAAFDPKAWAKNGVTEEDVLAAKIAFDLFDSDQGGSVDIKGITFISVRAQGRHDCPRFRVQEQFHRPDDYRPRC